jgi:hypothetical protein
MRTLYKFYPDINWSNVKLILILDGIMASKTRHETPEGIELDLAVSYLSRVEIVNSLTMASNARVFVMGFPGQKMEANLEDFNSEKNYAAWPAHMQTVIGNEALVEFCSNRHSVNAYGLNPGLIRTEIRQKSIMGEAYQAYPALNVKSDYVAVIVSQFSFSRLAGQIPFWVLARTRGIFKALIATGFRMPKKNILNWLIQREA